MLKHVLVTLDGSELSEQALQYAHDILCENGKLTLLSVVDIPEVSTYNFYPVPVVAPELDQDTLVKNLREQANDYLNQHAEALKKQNLIITSIIQVGEPASVIVEQANKLKVDAIVMSTHGRSGLSRWLFGSVTQKVLSSMPCPVFVVPGKAKTSTEPVESEMAEA